MTPTQKDRDLMRWAGHRYRDYKLAAMFKVEARLVNQRRKLRLMEQNEDRLIPTSGAERRRRNAHRNAGMCLLKVGPKICHRTAVDGSLFCDAHQPELAR